MDTSGMDSDPPTPGRQGQDAPGEAPAGDERNSAGTSLNTGQPTRLDIQPQVANDDSALQDSNQQLELQVNEAMQRIRAERLNLLRDIEEFCEPTVDGYKKFFCKLRQAGEVFDGSFISSDDVKFEIHRPFILMRCAELGKKLFSADKYNSSVKLNTIEGDVLKIIIDHIYFEPNYEITHDNVHGVFTAAKELQLQSMIDCCRTFFNRVMKVENCIGIWRYSASQNCFELQHDAFIFLRRNFVDVYCKQDEFLVLSKEELEWILEDDLISAPKEQDLLDALASWVQHDLHHRNEDGKKLLKHVRFGIMANSYGGLANVDQIRRIYPRLQLWDGWVEKCERVLEANPEDEFGFRRIHYSVHSEQYKPRISRHVLMTIGGWSGGSPTSVAELYDVRADRWFRMPALNPNFHRAYHGTVVVSKKIYVFGGYDGNVFYNTLHELDTENITEGWKLLSCMNHARCYVTCCVLDRYIWAIGGLDGSARMRTVERYNIEQNQWELMPQMRVPRSDASAVLHKGKIYVCGGFDGNTVLHTVEYFNQEQSVWNFAPRMDMRRSGLSAVSYQGNLVVLGGYNGETRTNHVERYDEVTMAWVRMPDMKMAKSNFTTIIVDKKLYVFGGYDGNRTTNLVEFYDPEGEDGPEWTFVRPMSIPKSALGVAVLPEFSEQYSYLKYMERVVTNPDPEQYEPDDEQNDNGDEEHDEDEVEDLEDQDDGPDIDMDAIDIEHHDLAGGHPGQYQHIHNGQDHWEEDEQEQEQQGEEEQEEDQGHGVAGVFVPPGMNHGQGGVLQDFDDDPFNYNAYDGQHGYNFGLIGGGRNEFQDHLHGILEDFPQFPFEAGLGDHRFALVNVAQDPWIGNPVFPVDQEENNDAVGAGVVGMVIPAALLQDDPPDDEALMQAQGDDHPNGD